MIYEVGVSWTSKTTGCMKISFFKLPDSKPLFIPRCCASVECGRRQYISKKNLYFPVPIQFAQPNCKWAKRQWSRHTELLKFSLQFTDQLGYVFDVVKRNRNNYPHKIVLLFSGGPFYAEQTFPAPIWLLPTGSFDSV